MSSNFEREVEYFRTKWFTCDVMFSIPSHDAKRYANHAHVCVHTTLVKLAAVDVLPKRQTRMLLLLPWHREEISRPAGAGSAGVMAPPGKLSLRLGWLRLLLLSLCAGSEAVSSPSFPFPLPSVIGQNPSAS